MNRVSTMIGALAVAATAPTPRGYVSHNGYASFGYLSSGDLHNPPGSTPTHPLRHGRAARRARKMRLRKLRGYAR